MQNAHGARVLAPTARAVLNLKRRDVVASTVHSALYDFAGFMQTTTEDGETRREIKWDDKCESKLVDLRGVVVCDESSMINTPVANDIRRRAKKRIWVGDHGQLPPVGGGESPVATPDFVLTQIHRQAADSPIISLAYEVRTGVPLVQAAAKRIEDRRVRMITNATPDKIAQRLIDEPEIGAVIVARNATRRKINTAYRALRGFEGVLQEGERVIGVRNKYRIGVLNGEVYDVLGVFPVDAQKRIGVRLRDSLGLEVSVIAATEPLLGEECLEDFPSDVAELEYGYAFTCHKAQGCEWPTVLVLDERVDRPGWDMNRWRYVAVSRAKSSIIVATMGR